MTNCHKISGLKQHTFLILVSVSQDLGYGLRFRISKSCNPDACWAAGAFQGSPREGSTFRLVQLLAEFRPL